MKGMMGQDFEDYFAQKKMKTKLRIKSKSFKVEDGHDGERV